MKFYSRFVKISRVGQKISQKCHFLTKFSQFLQKKIFRGVVKAKDFFRWGVKAKHPHHHPLPTSKVIYLFGTSDPVFDFTINFKSSFSCSFSVIVSSFFSSTTLSDK
jgi:hypothetical protein